MCVCVCVFVCICICMCYIMYRYTGQFETEEDAAKAWDSEARRLRKNITFLNFPSDAERSHAHIVSRNGVCVCVCVLRVCVCVCVCVCVRARAWTVGVFACKGKDLRMCEYRVCGLVATKEAAASTARPRRVENDGAPADSSCPRGVGACVPIGGRVWVESGCGVVAAVLCKCDWVRAV